MHGHAIRAVLALETVRSPDSDLIPVLRRFDPTVSKRTGTNGHGGTKLFLASNSIWKVTDVAAEIEACRKLKGRQTKTLVHIMNAVDLALPSQLNHVGQREKHQSEGLWAIQMELLSELSQDERDLISAAFDHYQDHEEPTPDMDPDVAKALAWLNSSRAECEEYGAETTDILGYEAMNVMKDRQGDWRRIDL